MPCLPAYVRPGMRASMPMPSSQQRGRPSSKGEGGGWDAGPARAAREIQGTIGKQGELRWPVRGGRGPKWSKGAWHEGHLQPTVELRGAYIRRRRRPSTRRRATRSSSSSSSSSSQGASIQPSSLLPPASSLQPLPTHPPSPPFPHPPPPPDVEKDGRLHITLRWEQRIAGKAGRQDGCQRSLDPIWNITPTFAPPPPAPSTSAALPGSPAVAKRRSAVLDGAPLLPLSRRRRRARTTSDPAASYHESRTFSSSSCSSSWPPSRPLGSQPPGPASAPQSIARV